MVEPVAWNSESALSESVLPESALPGSVPWWPGTRSSKGPVDVPDLRVVATTTRMCTPVAEHLAQNRHVWRLTSLPWMAG